MQVMNRSVIDSASLGCTRCHTGPSRRGPESNRCTRLCRPLPNHSATPPRLGGTRRQSTRRHACGRPKAIAEPEPTNVILSRSALESDPLLARWQTTSGRNCFGMDTNPCCTVIGIMPLATVSSVRKICPDEEAHRISCHLFEPLSASDVPAAIIGRILIDTRFRPFHPGRGDELPPDQSVRMHPPQGHPTRGSTSGSGEMEHALASWPLCEEPHAATGRADTGVGEPHLCVGARSVAGVEKDVDGPIPLQSLVHTECDEERSITRRARRNLPRRRAHVGILLAARPFVDGYVVWVVAGVHVHRSPWRRGRGRCWQGERRYRDDDCDHREHDETRSNGILGHLSHALSVDVRRSELPADRSGGHVAHEYGQHV